jgi:energy-coupling factor transporter ATP-binding protein EcfA2
MRIQALAVEDFRCLGRQAVVDLAPGLNVLVGRNEAGKSTLFLALRAALFVRAGATQGQGFRPHGLAVEPCVRLTFQLEGRDYTLEKRFGTSGHTELAAADGRLWRGPEAEEALAVLLGYRLPRRPGDAAAALGAMGLLWVAQGEVLGGAGDGLPVPQDEARDRILGVLRQEAAAAYAGGGEALARQARERTQHYWGQKGCPVGEFRKALDRAETIQHALSRILAERASAAALAAQLATAEAAWAEIDTPTREAELTQRLAAAEAALATAQGAEQARAAAQARLAAVEGAERLARLAWEARQTAMTTADQRAEAAQAAAARATQAREAAAAAAARHSALQGEVADWAARRARMAVALARREAATRLTGLQARSARDGERRRRAEALAAALATPLAPTLAPERLARLRDLHQQQGILAERARALATRLDFDLLPGQGIAVAGQPRQGQGTEWLAGETEIGLPGLGTLRIRPGGEASEGLVAERAAVTAEWEALLVASGVTGLPEAEARCLAGQQAAAERQSWRVELQALAPDGLAALAAEHQRLGAETAALAAQCVAGGEDRVPAAGAPPAPPEEETLADLDGQGAGLEARLQALAAEMRMAREAAAGAEAEVGALARAREEVDAALAAARLLRPDLDLQRAFLAEAERARAAQAESRAHGMAPAVAEELAAGEPAPMTQCAATFAQARAVLAGFAAERAARREQVAHLRGELAGRGQGRLAEEEARVAEGLAAAQRAAAAEQRQAAAWRLLDQLFTAAREQAATAWTAPMAARLRPYLEELFAGEVSPEVADDLGLRLLTRAGRAEDPAGLSRGTREQIAILTRLAYADLLAAAGRPVSVWLDDALVYADDERRERMMGILAAAAARYQIVLLTCQGREYAAGPGTRHRFGPA